MFVGVDLGGTSVKVGLVDSQAHTLARTSLPTEPRRGPDDGVRRIVGAVHDLLQKANVQPGDVAGLGIGSPGTMDLPAGMLLDPPNLPTWQNFPLREQMQTASGWPVTFANDANAAAYGEYWAGGWSGWKSLVLLTLGTGVGCGIILGDLQIEGEHSHGGECGHIIIDYRDDARRCGCGGTGHLEAYASATALVQRAQEAVAAGAARQLAERTQNGAPLTPQLIGELAESGDEACRELVLSTARFLAVGVTSLMHTLDPSGVLLGGAMTFGGAERPLGREFLQTVRAEVRRRTFPVLAERTQIDFARLGNDAGYIGAAGVARADFLRRTERAISPRSRG